MSGAAKSLSTITGDAEQKAGVIFESAALKARQKCVEFVSRKSNAQGNARKAASYVPKVEAKVRRSWYTRRDQDGKTVLVQVEEGIDEEVVGDPKQRASDRERRSDEEGKNAGGSASAADLPFEQALQQQRAHIHPLSPFMRLWETLVLLLISAYFVMAVPLRIAFPRLWPTPGLVVLDTFCSVLLAADTALRFLVAFEQNEEEKERLGGDARERDQAAAMYSSANQDAHLVVDRARIVRRHLRGRFWVGLAAAFPFDLLLFAVLGAEWANAEDDGDIDLESLTALPPAVLTNPTIAAYFGLLRLACIGHLKTYFDKYEWASVFDTISDRILKNLMVGIIGAHWLACGFTYIGRLAETRGAPSHLSSPRELEYYAQVGSVGEGAQYARAIYWALTTMSGVGYGDITPVTMGETVYAAVAVSLGTSFFLFTVGTVTSLISSADAVNAQIKARLAGLKKWMSRAGLPPEMRVRVLENFYDQHVTRMGMEDRSMLHELPKFLQHEVAMYLNKDIVASTALFRGCSLTLVASIVEHLHAHRCLPLDLVIQKGEVADELYLIKRGLFEVLNEDGTVHRMLGPGSYFGEIALLCHVHRTMTVRAVTMGLVFVIEREQFNKIMSEYPTDLNQLLLSAALRYRTKPKPPYLVVGARKQSISSVTAPTSALFGEKNSILRGVHARNSVLGGLHNFIGGNNSAGFVSNFHSGLAPELSFPSRKMSSASIGSLGSLGSSSRRGSSIAGAGEREHSFRSRKRSLGRFGGRFDSASRAISSESVASLNSANPLAWLRGRRNSLMGGGHRGSVTEQARATQPLAFVPNAPIAALRESNRLMPISASEAEKLSELRDIEVVTQLRTAAEAHFKSARASIDIELPPEPPDDDEDADEAPRSRPSRVSRVHKSEYESNREKLQAALDRDPLFDESSFPGKRPLCRVACAAAANDCSSSSSAPASVSSPNGLRSVLHRAATPSAPPAAEAPSPAPAGAGTVRKQLGWFEC